MRYPLPWFLLSDDPRRCIRRTTGDYRRCRSSRAECRFSAVEVAGLLASFAFFVGLVMYLCQGFVCTSHALRQDWKFHASYGLLIWVWFLIFCYIRNSDIFIIKHIIPNLLIKFFCSHLLRYFKGCVSTRKLIM